MIGAAAGLTLTIGITPLLLADFEGLLHHAADLNQFGILFGIGFLEFVPGLAGAACVVAFFSYIQRRSGSSGFSPVDGV